jgi:hypothetical protein
VAKTFVGLERLKYRFKLKPLIKKGKSHSVYALLDPRDGTVRYIGASRNPARRLAEHCVGEQKNSAMRSWVQGLLTVGELPVMVILSRVSAREVAALEIHWIRRARNVGLILNRTKGGDCLPPDTSPKRRRPKRLRGVIDQFGLYKRNQQF